MKINLTYDSLRMFKEIYPILRINQFKCEQSLNAARGAVNKYYKQVEDYKSIVAKQDSIIQINKQVADRYKKMYGQQKVKTVKTSIWVGVGSFVLGASVPPLVYFLVNR